MRPSGPAPPTLRLPPPGRLTCLPLAFASARACPNPTRRTMRSSSTRPATTPTRTTAVPVPAGAPDTANLVLLDQTADATPWDNYPVASVLIDLAGSDTLRAPDLMPATPTPGTFLGTAMSQGSGILGVGMLVTE